MNSDGYNVTITGDRLCTLYDSIRSGQPNFKGLGPPGSRPADRALQLLRKAGLIEYVGTPKRWRAVGDPDV